jgi:hypothetical protein
MDVPLASQLRTHLASYLRDQSSLKAFEDWFVPNALSVAEETGDHATGELIYEIELRLAEFSHGDWDESDLKRLLQPLIVRQGVQR